MKKRELRRLIREEITRLNESDTIHISEIPDALKKWNLDHDDDNLHIFSETEILWAADNEQDYEKIEKLLNKEFRSKNYDIVITYDDSGYDYWMEAQEEPNHAALDIHFNEEEFPVKELKNLEKDLQKATTYINKVVSKFKWPKNIKK